MGSEVQGPVKICPEVNRTLGNSSPPEARFFVCGLKIIKNQRKCAGYTQSAWKRVRNESWRGTPETLKRMFSAVCFIVFLL